MFRAMVHLALSHFVVTQMSSIRNYFNTVWRTLTWVNLWIFFLDHLLYIKVLPNCFEWHLLISNFFFKLDLVLDIGVYWWLVHPQSRIALSWSQHIRILHSLVCKRGILDHVFDVNFWAFFEICLWPLVYQVSSVLRWHLYLLIADWPALAIEGWVWLSLHSSLVLDLWSVLRKRRVNCILLLFWLQELPLALRLDVVYTWWDVRRDAFGWRKGFFTWKFVILLDICKFYGIT